MSLIVTIMWLTEKGFSVKFTQHSPEDRVELTISNGKHDMSQKFKTAELVDAFDSDCYASTFLKSMAEEFMRIFKEEL